MGQRFAAREKFEFSNGAVGYGPGGPFDCLGPYAKVVNCPIKGHNGLRLTCYATGYADSMFSVPACTSRRGKHVSGFFTTSDDGGRSIEFVPMKHHEGRMKKMRTVNRDIARLHTGTFYHTQEVNADNTPVRCRTNGRCKTWKTRPDDYRVPVKYGLRDCFYIRPSNEGEWYIEEDDYREVQRKLLCEELGLSFNTPDYALRDKALETERFCLDLDEILGRPEVTK